jgi:hypothetical protein
MAEEKTTPAFPAWKAFVVQFSRDTHRATDACAGRVEHLSTGGRAHFSSASELLEALDRLLAASGDGSDSEE